MLILVGLLSLILTTAIFALGLFFLLTGKKVEGQEAKIQDEEHDIWYYLGFVDDTPNIIRAIVAGKEKTGRIIRYMGNIREKTVDPVTGVVTPYAGPGRHPNE